ncbi:MAG: DegT/DnrJ/EryC1/StrS family aminotransferase [Acidobacteriota bacterium]|nr:MAG: DegT/DnrJ/EryC1/StrS family aminotransferase [Acidobacteriota bacterium]
MYVPLWQPLTPGTLLRGKDSTVSESFPLNHPRAHYFYHARNGIYHIARKLSGLGFGKVLVPAYHHGVEVKALIAGGLEPVFYNVSLSCEIDFGDLESKISESTRALVVTHYNGVAQDLRRIKALKDEYGLVVIEDAALSLFARWGNWSVGQVGQLAIYCPYKTFPLPNGGLVIANDPEFDLDVETRRPSRSGTLARLGRLYLNWIDTHFNGAGQYVLSLRPKVKRLLSSMNYAPVPIGDAHFDPQNTDLGMSPISFRIMDRCSVPELLERRQRNFDLMTDLVRDLGTAATPLYPERPAGSVPLFYPLRVRDRERVYNCLRGCGIESSRFWKTWLPFVPRHNFPDVATLREEVLDLPIHQGVSPKQVEYIGSQLKICLKD